MRTFFKYFFFFNKRSFSFFFNRVRFLEYYLNYYYLYNNKKSFFKNFINNKFIKNRRNFVSFFLNLKKKTFSRFFITSKFFFLPFIKKRILNFSFFSFFYNFTKNISFSRKTNIFSKIKVRRLFFFFKFFFSRKLHFFRNKISKSHLLLKFKKNLNSLFFFGSIYKKAFIFYMLLFLNLKSFSFD